MKLQKKNSSCKINILWGRSVCINTVQSPRNIRKQSNTKIRKMYLWANTQQISNRQIWEYWVFRTWLCFYICFILSSKNFTMIAWNFVIQKRCSQVEYFFHFLVFKMCLRDFFRKAKRKTRSRPWMSRFLYLLLFGSQVPFTLSRQTCKFSSHCFFNRESLFLFTTHAWIY